MQIVLIHGQIIRNKFGRSERVACLRDNERVVMDTIGGLLVDGLVVGILVTFAAIAAALLHPFSYTAEIETMLPIALAVGGAAVLYVHR